MAAKELYFRARDVVTPEGVRPAAVHVRSGLIESLLPFDAVPLGAPLVDLPAGSALLPGVVDSHVHVNEPGRTIWEGFRTATQSAAAGGVTTLVDMPLNSIPPTTTVANFHAKREASEGQRWVDVGLWGGAVPGNAGELRELLRAGALGFKCFMVESGVDEFPHVGEADLRAAMTALAGTGAPLLVHAEMPGPIEAALRAAGGPHPSRSYVDYLRSRPREAEDQAIALLLSLGRQIPARLHVVHLSSSGALPLLEQARAEGVQLGAETTPHYLHFASEQIPDGDTSYKCAPPIRERENREALWGALGSGLIDLVVSDHSPCTPELKRLGEGDFTGAWGGIASLQLGLSVMWTDASARGLGLTDLSRLLSEGPARLAGLSGRKGAIAPGRDADLVVFRLDERFRVDPARLLHRHKVTPYAGEELRGVVAATYLRGEAVYERGKVSEQPLGGLLLRESV